MRIVGVKLVDGRLTEVVGTEREISVLKGCLIPKWVELCLFTW